MLWICLSSLLLAFEAGARDEMQGAGSLQHAELLPRRSLDTFGLVDKRRALPLRSSQYKHLLKRGKELDYSRMFGAPKKSKEKKEEKKEEKEEVKKAKQEEQGPSSAAMQTQAEGTSSAGGTSLERSSSPDWKTLDPATRDPGQVLADSQRPHAVERDRARFQQDPLAYDRVRNTDAWTIVHPGRLEWSPTPPGRRLVLTGLGECLAVIAFTERGALAFHVQTRNDANTRWKDRREHEADARRFARTLKAHVGHATPPVRLHVVASDHLYTGRWMGEAYKANLQAALGAVGLRHDRILTQHYPKPASPAKERYNVVVDPRAGTVLTKKTWMREVDFMMSAGRQGVYGDRYKGFPPDNLPPDLQPDSLEPHREHLWNHDALDLPPQFRVGGGRAGGGG